ncbi:MAG: glycosyltransferase family 4 protein [Ferruginibacter sp.]|nr:glycosyltransferase family 4 protein [Ferruginibacter sp.]
MKISYVTNYDAMDIHNWSGLGYSIAKMLENQHAEIDYVGNLELQTNIVLRLKQRIYKRLTGQCFELEREPFVAGSFARQIQLKLKTDTDIIFSPASTPISLLKTNKPKVFYTDATFAGMLGFYDAFSNLTKESIRHGNYLEQKALDSVALAIYSSDWAAKSAMDDYHINPAKIKVVPFGANVQNNLQYDDIKNIIQNRKKEVCNLLFIGVEWKRKGGDIAIKITERLNELGIKTQLHMVGAKKIPIETLPGFVIDHGFVSKATEEGRNRINDLLATSHFLLLPTRADCTPVVYSEANSFGLPCISTNVGGISTIIRDNVNGKTFDLDTDVNEWCNFIIDYFTDAKKYNDLCLSSFSEYQNRLNWNVAGIEIMKLLKEI